MKRLPPDPSPPEGDNNDDVIETTAAEWLVELDEGFAPGRAARLAAWRAADPRHESAFVRTARALDFIAELPGIGAPLAARLSHENRVVRAVFFRFPVLAASLAAALAFAAALAWFAPTRPDAVQRYATAPTRQQEIALNDGSVVNLNIGSEVRVQLTPVVRRVTLDAGEAYFAVAHDTSRPFIVTAGGVSVRAVGTAFSVRLGERGVEVLVTEGRVEITRDTTGSTLAATLADALPASHPLLVAGERTFIARDIAPAATQIERVSADALEASVRWHSRVMTFSDLPLRDAVTLFNRRNLRQLVLADPALGERRIGGTFAADQVDALVRLLVQDGDIAVERRDAGEIVLRRAPSSGASATR